MANRPAANPFYIEITNVKEDFQNAQGVPSSVDLPLISLPAGTVLFRGLKIPNAKQGEDIRYFYRDFLGTPEGSEDVCLSPTHNVFFYPFPYVAFGANDVGKTYTMMQMVVLVNPVTLVCCVSPSPFVRGISKRYTGTAPWQRCSNFSGPTYDCHPQSAQEADAKTYDSCLRPEYQVRSGTRGWMAIANLDSLTPQSTGFQPPMSSIGTFLKTLNAQIPGEGKKAAAWAYTDQNRHAGFPEIALYPYRSHKGPQVLKRHCSTERDAIRLMEREAANDNLNYLPIAAFTKDSMIDMTSGYFTYERLNIRDNSFDTVSAQQSILENMHDFMEKLQTSGITLPYYGPSRLVFDSRTGFFAFNSVVPQSLMIPKAASPYRSVLMSLQTQQDQIRALKYMLVFRTYLPENFMKQYPIEGGFSARRAMIFSRPPVLANLFKDLQMEVPREFMEPLARGSRFFRQESARPIASVPPAQAQPPLIPLAPIQVPQRNTTPEYGAYTPPGWNAERQGPWKPTTGGKKTRSRSRYNQTRRTTSPKKYRQYASLFANVWKRHAKV
jgi:hypothetical protein